MKTKMMKQMTKTSLQQAILNLEPGQRRAAFALALGLIVLLIATIVTVVLVSTGALRPTPTTRLQSDYLKALDSESAAVRAAKAAGHPVARDRAVVKARGDLVLLEILAGDSKAALRRARGLAQGAPQNAQARYVYGVALAATGSTKESLTEFKAALRLVKDVDTELKRSILAANADALIKEHHPEKACELLRQAAAVPPASADLYVRAAILATGQRQFQDAATDYLQALTYDPQNTAATTGLHQLELEHPSEVKAARLAGAQL